MVDGIKLSTKGEFSNLAKGQIYYWQDKDIVGDNNSAGYPEFIASTDYSTGEGLGGYNCRHSFYPFFVGVSKPSYTKSELDNFDKETYTYKGKTYTTYDVTQKQRSFERAMRESKLKILGYRNLGDNDASLYESVRLRRLQDEYKVFSQATSSRAKLERTGVVGYNRGVSDKVIAERNRALQKAEKRYPNSPNQLDNYLKDRVLINTIKKRYNLTVHKGRQGKHIRGHNNYKGGSYLLDGVDPQELFDKYAFTEDFRRAKESKKWTGKEFILAEDIIGVDINPEGVETPTRYFSIHYSKKKGFHIVPRREKNDSNS